MAVTDLTLDDAKALIEKFSLTPRRPGTFYRIVRSGWLLLEECRRLEREQERRIAQRRSEANTPRSESGPERRSWQDRRCDV